MPPEFWDIAGDYLFLLILPTLGASLAVMLDVCYRGGGRYAPLAAALAVTAGLASGTFVRSDVIDYRVDSDRPWSVTDLATVLGWSLEGQAPPKEGEPPPEDPPPKKQPRYWLIWLAGLALAVESLVRLMYLPAGVAWSARTLMAAFAGRVLTHEQMRQDMPWMPWVVGLGILLEWAVLVNLAGRWKDGVAALAAAVGFWAAAVVLIHAHYNRGMDMALFGFAAVLGPAVGAWIWRGDTGTALAAAAVYLPGVVLTGQWDASANDNKVPLTSFICAGLAPVALAPMLLPGLNRLPRWARWLPALILVLIPALIAVGLAAQMESIDFGSKNEWE
jgi:hypothetical protein